MKDNVNNIEAKLVKFIAKYELISKEKLLLEQENNASIAALESKEKEILNLEEKIKLMNISKSGGTSENEVKETRLKINEYVREIDKCIALLNN